MSRSIIVVRGDGDKQGTDIKVNYYKSEKVFRAVGRIACDKSEAGLKIVSIRVFGARPPVRPGKIIRLLDGAKEYRGKVKSIRFSRGRNADRTPLATCHMVLRLKEIV